jgi:hypothetical protein
MAFSGFDDMTNTRKFTRSHQKFNGICAPMTITADRLKIEIPINIEIPNNETGATYNKDNKVNKLVTVFAVPYLDYLPANEKFLSFYNFI